MFFVCIVTCPGIERLSPTGSGAAQRLCGLNSTPKPPIAFINSNAGPCPLAALANANLNGGNKTQQGQLPCNSAA